MAPQKVKYEWSHGFSNSISRSLPQKGRRQNPKEEFACVHRSIPYSNHEVAAKHIDWQAVLGVYPGAGLRLKKEHEGALRRFP